MDERRFQTPSRAGRLKIAAVLALLACLLAAACAQRDDGSDKDQPGGLYGGLSSGLTR
ncbi:MAG TPA: hypothetical protein VGS13_10770 [Stellaceae bacterium]|nr:hypothetical protein [Stellaceae bacterium]